MKPAVARRQYADLEFHLDLRRSLRVGRAKRSGWQVLLEIEATHGVMGWTLRRVAYVPEPFQAPVSIGNAA